MKSSQLLFFTLLITSVAFANPPLEEGKAIFLSRCAACHNVNKTLTGPALAGVDERRDMEWIVSFVHSSQKLVKAGDPVATELFKKFNNIPMPDHPDLTSDHIKSIVEYIKSETVTADDTKAPFAKPKKLQKSYLPLKATDYLFWGLYLFAVLLLVWGFVFAVKVKTAVREVNRTED